MLGVILCRSSCSLLGIPVQFAPQQHPGAGGVRAVCLFQMSNEAYGVGVAEPPQ